MIEIPGDAKSAWCYMVKGRNYTPHSHQTFAEINFPAQQWNNPRVYCWFLKHYSGVYVIYSKWTGKEPKRYPDLDTAKIATELQAC